MQVAMRLANSSRDGRVHLVTQIAAELRVGERTLWRWLRRFEDSGVAGLTKRSRSDRGRSRWFAKHPHAAIEVWRRWLQGWPVTAIHDYLHEEFLTAPNLQTLYAFIRSLRGRLQ